MSADLRSPMTAAEWAAYHNIRRRVLFELRGQGDVYDSNHPDELRTGHHPLILWNGAEAVGVIRVDIEADVAIFRRVAIREDVQRRGLGRRLLSHAERFAETNGCTQIASHVDAGAVGFYERCGFRRADSVVRESESVFMTKGLAGADDRVAIPPQSIVVPAAVLTVRDLVGGLLIAVALGAAIDGIGKPFPMVARTLAVLVAGSVLFASARIWAGDIARLDGSGNAERARRATPIALVPALVIVGLGLSLLEPVLVERATRAGIAVHVVYTLLFAPATLVVAGVGAFALGAGLYDTTVGRRLAIGAGLAAAAAFLAIDLVMNALGWRVGAPDAGKRATMVVVTAVGLLAAAISAGSAIGAMLARPGPFNRPDASG
jgi:GNAT superfamily N-acetyltransferase